MSNVPPILPPPVLPPSLPAEDPSEKLGRYVYRCKVLCIVEGSVFLVGVIGFIDQIITEHTANFSAFGFGVFYVLMAYGGAWLLHHRRTEGYLVAFLSFLILLILIPVGTVFGILGLIWLNKGRVLLTRKPG